MPLHRRLPKRGFTNIFKKQYAIVNVGRLEQLEGDSFSPERLLELGVIKKLGDGLKILGAGELTRQSRCRRTCSRNPPRRRSRPPAGSVGSDRRRPPSSRRASRTMNKFFEAVANVFRIPDLRRRVLFTLGLLAVYRLGGHIPTPGIDANKLEEFFQPEPGHAVRVHRPVLAAACSGG